MKVTITKKDAAWDFDVDHLESILYAGLRQGLNLPYECATGTCGTCKARLVSGELDQGWEDAPGRSHLKINRGEFLMCQCRALGDCEIRVPGDISITTDGSSLPAHRIGKLKNRRLLTHDVLRFDVELESPLQFRAGQFVVLASSSLNGFRAYSMVNYADATGLLELVIKRLPGGKFSDWVFDHFDSDSEVSVFGPLGTAVFEPELNKDILCIAGGSGIAGMMSILAHGCRDDYFSSHRAHLFFGVRTPQDIFFYFELLAMAKQYPKTLSITIALSDEALGSQEFEQPGNISFTTGFVHEAARHCELDQGNSMAYIAGPPPMVDAALRDLLMESGYTPDQIRYDKFG